MLKEKLKNKIHTSHFALHTSRNNGITLIALIITIIVMLILTGVTLSITLGDNGLVNKAKEATTQTQVAMDRELLLSAVVGAIGNDGKVNLTAINLPEGFTGSNGTYTSKNGNTFTVSVNGEIVYTSSDNVIENGDEIQTGTVDLNGRYYRGNINSNECLILENHNKYTYINYDESHDETYTDECDIEIEFEENSNTGIMTITYVYDDLDFNIYNETDAIEIEQRPFVYALIKENNQIVNKVFIMLDSGGVYIQNTNGIEYPLDGDYVSSDGSEKIVFEEGNSDVDCYYKSGTAWNSKSQYNFYEYCKAGDTYYCDGYPEATFEVLSDLNSFTYDGVTYTKQAN